MIYIRKQRTPDTVRKRAKELTDASENDFNSITLPKDTKLVARRKNIYESVCQEFERWDKQKRLTRDFLKDIIEKCENMMNRDGIAEEYIGERLYFYRKKYRKMER
ncbi:MAG: hypothetical protein LUJ25_01020 [Firmicutes bacterium]|nr:hypothetical protein [Bacillota bacterium]